MEELTTDILDLEYVPAEGVDEPVDVTGTELVAAPVTKEAAAKKAEAETDFQTGRELLNRSAESMKAALANMDELGTQVETANFWSAYVQMIMGAGVIAKDLMELHQKKDGLAAFIDNPDEPEAGIINIEKAVVYTGNTADMQRQLKREKLSAQEAEISGKNSGKDIGTDVPLIESDSG